MKLNPQFKTLSESELQSVAGGFSLLRFIEHAVKWLSDVLVVKPTT